jgi:hypothetical protein
VIVMAVVAPRIETIAPASGLPCSSMTTPLRAPPATVFAAVT